MSELGVWAKRPEPHSTPETANTRCDGCPHLSCIPQEGARLHKWAYYCDAMHRRFTFKELFAIGIDDCPEHKTIRRKLR